ncbi:aluminum-activated malate transporter 8-like isoform X2 [Salvia miltiorrhiza]|uniref:aluminum-activated malate transporter 8-like isoform X2 n=1 Tax=Salvia miltiorrhiza TaxID=226208 RepID=UPI0025AC60C6|nr:aluminum-activated malate transporter 8-like isoform X2 [Salvia miltiorrhiza]XP_057781183.1 aluminum-activated malate transporter 8-like isoform X2 [Salvia miltiorrhiza]
MFGKIKVKVMDSAKYAKKLGEEDPRRIFHAVKVGIAITLMSMFYYFKPLYHSFEEAGMWAILTVVVVFEFTVGGTIAKGLNRGAATLLAAGLGVGAEYLGNACGDKGEPIILGTLVFILASVATFTRFVPRVKRRYDYGVTIFILTFALVAVSGARASEILKMAYERLTTILIGGATCMLISVCIYPVWAGQDLHNLIATNIQNLATFLEADAEDKSYLQSHKTVLNSKANEEILANFAWWELGHGGFKFNHPWKLYLNIGSLVRECACQIETLSGCLNSKSQAICEFQRKIQPACVEMSIEASKALRELGAALKEMRFPSSAVEIHLRNSKAAAEKLQNIMHNSSVPTKADFQHIVPTLVIASVLIDIIKFIDKTSSAVDELSQKAGFKLKPVDHNQVVVDIVEIKTESS